MWVPARADQTSGYEHVSLIYDDRELLELRVKRLGHPLLHSQDPMTRVVRLVGNSTVARDAPPRARELKVRSNFIMVDYRRRLHRFFGGTYEHELRREGEGWLIAAKIVRLVNSEDYHSNFGIPI